MSNQITRSSIAGSRSKALPIKSIRLDGGTQSRDELNEDVIRDYADMLADGIEFPPLLVVHDGSHYWLVDGFHRRFAAVKAKLDKFKCIVVTGTREDARWMSYGANIDHGLQRTNEDKAKSVVAALKHPMGLKLSDSKIAEHVGVNHSTVAKYRKQIEPTCEISKSTARTGRDGRTINTANIGKKLEQRGEDVIQRTTQRAECDIPDSAIGEIRFTCPKCGQPWPEGRAIHGKG